MGLTGAETVGCDAVMVVMSVVFLGCRSSAAGGAVRNRGCEMNRLEGLWFGAQGELRHFGLYRISE